MTGPVLPIEWCQWCRSHVPEGHACPFAPPPCPTESGDPCGTCESCLGLQEADPRYGPRPDTDNPENGDTP
ncbi:hypothetical protein N5079_19590 [Planotetraspora sp. A-T 1434]|uniref:hypothetical protein n=1 Tax=Planotetraspora sp. A-T 1434 TaxID=2979219 RepID=UPI0021BEE29D|nr:hypothetical protein [Planotetraspora sp. A-T 1434]MCT9932407.1 hypothetical protein [Planotetraspora sp. A-T 1434]